MSHRHRLIREMHQAGLRLDDAALASDVALRCLREQRNELIRAARSAGLSYRQIARIVALSPARVVAVFSAGSSV